MASGGKADRVERGGRAKGMQEKAQEKRERRG